MLKYEGMAARGPLKLRLDMLTDHGQLLARLTASASNWMACRWQHLQQVQPPPVTSGSCPRAVTGLATQSPVQNPPRSS
jgi:hypothetical protein